MATFTMEDAEKLLRETLPDDKNSYSITMSVAFPCNNCDKIVDGVYLGNQYLPVPCNLSINAALC